MHWIRNIVREVFGLFVDDGSFALTILVWIGIVWFVLHKLKLPIPGGMVLFAGLGIVLIESVYRFSRKAAASRRSPISK